MQPNKKQFHHMMYNENLQNHYKPFCFNDDCHVLGVQKVANNDNEISPMPQMFPPGERQEFLVVGGRAQLCQRDFPQN